MRITLVAAMTLDRLIGSGGKLPWHLPEDLKHFRNLTTGHAVVMGRKTYDSVGKPLKNRRNIVITRNPNPPITPGVEWVHNIQEAIAAARAAGESELFVVGGAEIYAQSLPIADRLYLTFVHVSPPPTGDAYFPAWDAAQWQETQRTTHPHMDIVIYDRKTS